jgi:hypothetical protein
MPGPVAVYGMAQAMFADEIGERAYQCPTEEQCERVHSTDELIKHHHGKQES